MEINKFFKKGQSLPLNTIVIAILVVIVLVVIIVFFTTSTGDSMSTVNENSASKCTSSNAALQTLGYIDITSTEMKCSELGEGFVEVSRYNSQNEEGDIIYCCAKEN
jgi:ABC-type uncharacterized transport system permease subunit